MSVAAFQQDRQGLLARLINFGVYLWTPKFKWLQPTIVYKEGLSEWASTQIPKFGRKCG